MAALLIIVDLALMGSGAVYLIVCERNEDATNDQAAPCTVQCGVVAIAPPLA